MLRQLATDIVSCLVSVSITNLKLCEEHVYFTNRIRVCMCNHSVLTFKVCDGAQFSPPSPHVVPLEVRLDSTRSLRYDVTQIKKGLNIKQHSLFVSLFFKQVCKISCISY